MTASEALITSTQITARAVVTHSVAAQLSVHAFVDIYGK